jgi:hypothetical protein
MHMLKWENRCFAAGFLIILFCRKYHAISGCNVYLEESVAAYIIVSVLTVFCLFILFLVLSRSLNTTINNLSKIEYLLTSASEFGSERQEIARILQDKDS